MGAPYLFPKSLAEMLVYLAPLGIAQCNCGADWIDGKVSIDKGFDTHGYEIEQITGNVMETISGITTTETYELRCSGGHSCTYVKSGLNVMLTEAVTEVSAQAVKSAYNPQAMYGGLGVLGSDPYTMDFVWKIKQEFGVGIGAFKQQAFGVIKGITS